MSVLDLLGNGNFPLQMIQVTLETEIFKYFSAAFYTTPSYSFSPEELFKPVDEPGVSLIAPTPLSPG